MAQIPPLPPRDSLPDGLWIVLDKIRSMLMSHNIKGDGKTIKVNYTDGGGTVSAIPNSIGFTEKEVFFLEVTDIDADGCPGTIEWHKYTIPIISDVIEDPPTV